MDYLFKNSSVSVRKMRDSICDYVFLTEWLSAPGIQSYNSDEADAVELDKVIKQYNPRIKEEDGEYAFIIEYDGIAVGYMQYYDITDELKSALKDNSEEAMDKTMAIDILIGKSEYQNMGIGTETITGMAEYMLNNGIADMIVAGPSEDNLRAIRCFEKSGFSKLRTATITKDGRSKVTMIVKKK
ncbi:MAG: acetyltransferase [Lachnospiraceae bacterium]|nr:acetyltransferase [Lachnospiraceae bacterium]